MKLPVLPSSAAASSAATDDAPSPCFGCTTPCCFEYVVPVNGHDLWRLVRTLAVPWSSLAAARTTPDDWGESFTLHRGGPRRAFRLRQRAGGGCGLLMTVGSRAVEKSSTAREPGHCCSEEVPPNLRLFDTSSAHRCGVHDARPLACRVYPLQSAWRAPTGVDFLSHALCPPPQRARFEAQKGRLADVLVADLLERALYLRVVARWDEAAAQQPREQPFTIDDYVSWTLSLYDSLAPLRHSGPRASWQDEALARVSRAALPFEWAPGC